MSQMIIPRRQVADVDAVYGPGCCTDLVTSGLAVIQERTPQQQLEYDLAVKRLNGRAQQNLEKMRRWGADVSRQPGVNRFAGVRVPERKVRQ